jgi:hypothetical protein
MIKPGISSSTTDLEGYNLLTALQTSALEVGARSENSEACERAMAIINRWKNFRGSISNRIWLE